MQWLGIMQQISADLKTIIGTQTPAVAIGIGWPPVETLQGVGQGDGNLITVFDRNPARDSTRWMPFYTGNMVVPDASITTVLGVPQVAAGHTTTLTVTGTPSFANGDAASLNVNGAGIVYITVSNDTLNSFTAALAAAINTAFTGVVTASASANVITLTNVSSLSVNLTSLTGAGGNILLEVERKARSVQVVVWANTMEQRETIAGLIESRFADLQSQFGYTFSDGTMARLTVHSDVNRDDNLLQNVYRRDFVIGLDYGVTVADKVYSVLAQPLNVTFAPAS
jgi:hypothetical protein